MNTLADIEKLFWSLIRAPEGVEAAAESGFEGVTRQGLEAVFMAPAGVAPSERVDIYANMYFWRLFEVLSQDFPRLSEAVGEASFRNWMTSYVFEQPSRHPSLRHFGAGLAKFLRGREPAWASDLATIEWFHADLFDSADANVLDLERVRDEMGLDFASSSLELHPSLRLQKLDFDVCTLWQQLADGQHEVQAPEQREIWVRAWRSGFETHHRAITQAEHDALHQALAGAPLPAICEAFVDGKESDPVQAAFTALVQWAEAGLICRFVR